ncbi:MAG: heavy-metal-associated domain-containing protein [Bacteroidales bacterium]|nr:heavy-metal-associated domain-containing protein [Bacteroidales bacterium]
MKRIMIMAVAALFLAAPVVLAQNPEKTRTEKASKSEENICTITFATDMHCESCVTKINENIAFEKGVKDLKVSLEEEKITIKYDKRKTSEEVLAASVRKLGYKAEKVN